MYRARPASDCMDVEITAHTKLRKMKSLLFGRSMG